MLLDIKGCFQTYFLVFKRMVGACYVNKFRCCVFSCRLVISVFQYIIMMTVLGFFPFSTDVLLRIRNGVGGFLSCKVLLRGL